MNRLAAVALVLTTALATPSASQRPGDYQCRLAWAFPAGDKSYTGYGLTEKGASDDAVGKCIGDQANNQKHICAGSPRVRSCGKVPTPQPPPPEAPINPAMCVIPRPEEIARVKGLPYRSETRTANYSESAHTKIELPPGVRVSKVYCRVQDSEGERWCRDTPERPEGCDYWAWTKPDMPGWYPRISWRNDHWRVYLVFYNQRKKYNRSFQIYAE